MALGSRTRLELLEGLRTSPRELGECREHMKKSSRPSRSIPRGYPEPADLSFYRPTGREVKLGVQTTCTTRPPPLNQSVDGSWDPMHNPMLHCCNTQLTSSKLYANVLVKLAIFMSPVYTVDNC